jgi:hypothetical protein
MGYNIYLKGDSFDHDGWVEDLGKCQLDISPMGSQLAGLLVEQQVEEMWLHPRGGLRGVTVRQTEQGAELSLPVGVSEAEFLLTGVLVRAALVRGAVVEDEEGRILTGAEEEMRTLGLEYRQFFWSTLSHKLAEGENTLPVGGTLHLKISSSECGDAGWDELERKQLDKMARYQEAFIASLMQVKIQGLNQLLSNYHHLPTLISSQAAWVTMNGDHGNITEGVPLAAEHFYQILADRFEHLGNWIFVPAIDFTAEPELAGKFKAAAGSASSSALPLPTGMANSSAAPTAASVGGELTGEDWMLLAKMLILCTYMVAGADGEVDRKEAVAIHQLLQSHQSCPNPVLAKILGIACGSLEHIAQKLQEEAMPPLFHFAILLGVLKKFPDHEASQIKAGFLIIAQAVAESSGGFLGFGSKVSKKEKEVLDFLKSALS